jgi:RHS repeat-associated protein
MSFNLDHIIKEDHYYPFGLNISALSSTAPLSKPNNFKYNGKEFDKDFDLGWYHYGARMYDPQLGRFPSVDPLADAFVSVSPYVYNLNNPVYFVDPDGRIPLPGPFTGRGYRQKNSIINVYRITPAQRKALTITKEITFIATGWAGVAASTYEAFAYPTGNLAYDGVKVLTPTVTKAAEKAVDAALDWWYKGYSAGQMPGKYDIGHARGVGNTIVRPALKVIGYAGLLSSMIDNYVTSGERLEGLTFEIGDKMIRGSNINIVQDGLFQVNDENTSVEGVENKLNTIYTGLSLLLADYDLSTDQGYADARKFINDNSDIINGFLQLLWRSSQENDEDKQDEKD